MTRTIGIAILTSSAVFGQTFEVASVKLHPGGASNMNITTSGPRFRASAELLAGLVSYAFDLKNYQLAWTTPNSALDDMFFDIEAKAEGDAAPSPGDFRKMLQSLLADRFKLRFHHEMRETQVFALVVGKNGPKFKESASDAVVSGRHGVNGRNQDMTLTKATMEQFAQQLPVYAGRPVIDKTGLVGAYDIKMEATPYFRMNRDPDPGDISVLQAVQQQLGLKLEAQKAMVDVLVVDHVEKPTGN
jgi:uncharacterized protein (TIGR03435 family)